VGNVRKITSWVVFAGLIVAGVLLWNNRTVVADQYRLIGYSPPANIAALSANIGFSDEGQRYFYASHPAIEDKTAFNAACNNTEVHAMVLGCYVDYNIYVYNVTDTRLDGVQEVTAAHEMLHAAYDRLSDDEKSDVDGMLQREYDSLSGDADFKERFSVYNSLSQADKLNELHSIFGTEFASLSSELESYYKQYFKDRGVVTTYYASYQSQFDSLKKQQDALKTQIDSLKREIDETEKQYDADRNALNSDIQAFNQRASSGGYSSQSQFNADRAGLVARSSALNQTANTINAKIAAYNDAIRQYNELSIQTQNLQNSLDSNSVESAPTV
jgi:cell division protein FtsB